MALLEGNLQGVQHVGIPVLDLEKAKAWYTDMLGFDVIHEPNVVTDAGDIQVAFLRLGDMIIECYQLVGNEREDIKTRGHGHIDHITIDVLNIDTALNNALKAGAVIDESTPDGPVLLKQFWSKGVKYIMLKGPTGEKIELNQRLDLDPSRRQNMLGGWSHLGIPVTDIEQSQAFYHQFGFTQTMSAAIPVNDEAFKAVMMEKDGFVIELYRLVGDKLAEIATRQDGHIDHVAMAVLDIDAAFGELKTAGMDILEDAPVLLEFWEKGCKYFNIRGPNGEKLEFNRMIQ